MFAKKSEKLESFIGNTTSFKGEIKTKGTLRVDGAVEGDIEAECLLIGEGANIRGNVEAGSIVVGGKMEGNVFARNSVEVRQKGSIKGDITTNRLMVMEGGAINGKTTMTETAETKVVEFSKEMHK